MAAEVVMPALGPGHEAARVVRWLKREGEQVRRGEPLLEVETEKAVIEVEARGSGILSGVRVREGEEAAVGTVLAYLLAPAAMPRTSGGVWRAAAERAAQSWREAPHLFLFRDADVSQLIVAASRMGTGVTPADLLLRLTAALLVRHPALNCGRDEVDLAVVVAGEDGPVTPVIRGAAGLDVAALAARRADLEARVREGGLRPADLAGASFTVSDLGRYGVDGFLPTLPEGQTGTLGVGRVADRVVPVRGRPHVRPAAALTLACDQRAVDGLGAARFLGELAEAVEEPSGLL